MEEKKLLEVKRNLEEDCLGKIPLHFSSIFYGKKEEEKEDGTEKKQLRKISAMEVKDYVTRKYPFTQLYNKPISKMI